LEQHIPIIVKFTSAFRVHNHKGSKIQKEDREASCFIIVLRGKIAFTQNGKKIVATPKEPIYIPSGTSYLNECLEDAESLLFNFKETTPGDAILALSYIEPQKSVRIFERILVLNSQNSLRAEAEIFSLLYTLARECYSENTTAERSLIAPALEYIELHLTDPDLTVKSLAARCCISTVYLNRLFKKEFRKTPFSYVTRRRMETARDMLHEHCPVGEIARLVGYGDIYQFSRAFKHYYGVSPTALAAREKAQG
jgi:AraC-like DNA-binding protein